MRASLPLLLSLLAVGHTPAAAPPNAGRADALRQLLVQDCGSCHGLTLKGGLGPPLRSQDLAGKSREMLVHTVLEGRPGTAMPPWRPFLSPTEAEWLVDLLISGEVVK